jgi:hypothetical protein
MKVGQMGALAASMEERRGVMKRWTEPQGRLKSK